MSGGLVSIPPGTVCVGCSVGGVVASDAVFQIDNSNISTRTGRVVDGVLVMFDTESLFTTAKHVQCMSVSLNANYSVLMRLNGKSFYTFFHDMKACVYMIFNSIQASRNNGDDHPQ